MAVRHAQHPARGLLPQRCESHRTIVLCSSCVVDAQLPQIGGEIRGEQPVYQPNLNRTLNLPIVSTQAQGSVPEAEVSQTRQRAGNSAAGGRRLCSPAPEWAAPRGTAANSDEVSGTALELLGLDHTQPVAASACCQVMAGSLRCMKRSA